jgi:hypothetical protein
LMTAHLDFDLGLRRIGGRADYAVNGDGHSRIGARRIHRHTQPRIADARSKVSPTDIHTLPLSITTD